MSVKKSILVLALVIASLLSNSGKSHSTTLVLVIDGTGSFKLKFCGSIFCFDQLFVFCTERI